MNCQGSSQVTDFASLASALARFGKVGREATNQKVGSSSPPGRTTFHAGTDTLRIDTRSLDVSADTDKGILDNNTGNPLPIV